MQYQCAQIYCIDMALLLVPLKFSNKFYCFAFADWWQVWIGNRLCIHALFSIAFKDSLQQMCLFLFCLYIFDDCCALEKVTNFLSIADSWRKLNWMSVCVCVEQIANVFFSFFFLLAQLKWQNDYWMTYLTDAFEALHIFDWIDSHFFAFIWAWFPSSHYEISKSIWTERQKKKNQCIDLSIEIYSREKTHSINSWLSDQNRCSINNNKP